MVYCEAIHRELAANGNENPVSPELSSRGVDSLLRVALATEDAVMRAYWPELEHRLLQNLDILSDEQLSSLLAVPHWQVRICDASVEFSGETRARVEALRPRSGLSRVIHSIRRRLTDWNVPEGVTSTQADAVILDFQSRILQAKQPLCAADQIAIMNELVGERFGHLDDVSQRAIRFYFYERQNLIGAL